MKLVPVGSDDYHFRKIFMEKEYDEFDKKKVLQKKNSFIDFLAKYDKYNENFKENFNPILNKACQMKIDTNAKNQDVLNNQYIRKKLKVGI